MKLQLALDLLTPDEALAIGEKAAPWFHILEVGTPMVTAYGMEPVRRLRAAFPSKEILADVKIVDSGRVQAQYAFDAGADWVTVLAAAEDVTIGQVVRTAKERGGRVMADLTAVADPVSRARELESLGVDAVCVHTPRDLADQGVDPLEELAQVAPALIRTSVAVAGGISSSNIQEAVRLGAGIVVVGGAVTRNGDPAAAAARLAGLLQPRRERQ